MSRILTYTKKMFDPLAPETELIEIRDIAHALSYLCRANGHFKSFYSVCQHCVNCANEAKARGYSHRVQLACLLHDASEAYLSDVTRPVKEELPQYKKIEEPLQDAIWAKWLGQPLDETEYAQVFEIDDHILENEFVTLMGYQLKETLPVLQSEPAYDFREFSYYEQRFLQIFRELTK